MIKVLHVVSIMDRAGQESFIMNMYRNIDRTKVQFDFLVCITRKGDFDDEIKALGGHIIYLDINITGPKLLKYYNKYRAQAQFLSSLAKNYDIVHIHNYHALTSFIDVKSFEKAGFKKIILHSHSHLNYHWVRHKMFKPLLSMDKNIIRYACSKEAGEWLHGKQNFEIINNGVDVDKFQFNKDVRDKLRSELGIENNYVIGMVGRLSEEKNHKFALDIFKDVVKENDKARLVIVGKGPKEDEIKEQIHELGLDNFVIMLGIRDDVNKLLSVFDVYFMPSIVEGLPVSFIEAEYSGLPSVVSEAVVDAAIKIPDVIKLSLNQNKNIWVDSLLKYVNKNRCSSVVTGDEYNVKTVAKDLEKRYIEIAKE